MDISNLYLLLTHSEPGKKTDVWVAFGFGHWQILGLTGRLIHQIYLRISKERSHNWALWLMLIIFVKASEGN